MLTSLVDQTVSKWSPPFTITERLDLKLKNTYTILLGGKKRTLSKTNVVSEMHFCLILWLLGFVGQISCCSPSVSSETPHLGCPPFWFPVIDLPMLCSALLYSGLTRYHLASISTATQLFAFTCHELWPMTLPMLTHLTFFTAAERYWSVAYLRPNLTK